jgi:putative tryptophan/tyrosine transport system substrate-binding protein
MRRRELITLLGGTLAWPLAARAQQPATPVIGILGGQSPETYEPFLVPFRQGLSEVGFVEGNNVAIESRWARSRYDRLPDLADVLVSRRVALIYAIGGTEVALAAKGATQIIPIVFTIGGDPVKAGVVASLNRPGGNVTGTSFLTVGLGTKRLELLYELVPRASVIAVLVQTGSAIVEEQLSDLQQAANALRLRLVVLAVTGDADLEPAFAKVALEGAGALCVTAGSFGETIVGVIDATDPPALVREDHLRHVIAHAKARQPRLDRAADIVIAPRPQLDLGRIFVASLGTRATRAASRQQAPLSVPSRRLPLACGRH